MTNLGKVLLTIAILTVAAVSGTVAGKQLFPPEEDGVVAIPYPYTPIGIEGTVVEVHNGIGQASVPWNGESDPFFRITHEYDGNATSMKHYGILYTDDIPTNGYCNVNRYIMNNWHMIDSTDNGIVYSSRDLTEEFYNILNTQELCLLAPTETVEWKYELYIEVDGSLDSTVLIDNVVYYDDWDYVLEGVIVTGQ